jgi:glycerol uptake facilitator-like aquaporin
VEKIRAVFYLQYSTGVLAGDQVLGTGLLLLIICAVTDPRNLRISPSFVPLFIGLGLTTIHLGYTLISTLFRCNAVEFHHF